MSLLTSPAMTAKNLAAHRANARKSTGATTCPGKERARAANLRHGHYSMLRDEALTALGEDPAALAALITGAYEQWRPRTDFEAALAERAACLHWRMLRAARLQASLAEEQVRRVERTRTAAFERQCALHVEMVDFVTTLRPDLLRPDFFTTTARLQEFTEAFPCGTSHEKEILRLLHRLRRPRELPPAATTLPAEATPDEEWQEGLRQAAEAEAEDPHCKLPLPHEPVAEGEEREAVREELLELVEREEALIEAAWESITAEDGAPLTPLERDLLAAPVSPQAEALRRQEDSCFRQFWRTATLLSKLQKERLQERGPEAEDRSPACPDREAPPDVGGREAEDTHAPAAEPGDAETASEVPGSSSRDRKTAGASGDMQENKEPGLSSTAECGTLATPWHRAEGTPAASDLASYPSRGEENRLHLARNIL